MPHSWPADRTFRAPATPTARLLSWLLVLGLCLIAFGASAGGLALDGAWLPDGTRQRAPDVARDDPRLTHFDTTQIHGFHAPSDSGWILLWPARGDWPSGDWVLVARSPGLQVLTFYPEDGSRGLRAELGHPAIGAWPAHDSFAFPIRRMPAAGEPMRVRVEAPGVITAPMSFSVQRVPDYLHADARWVAFASACLAVMVTMAVMALVFAVELADLTFAWYALFVLAYALILAIQTGYVFDPLGWRWMADMLRLWGRVATTVSVVAAILFLNRFADLRRYVPGGRVLLLGYAGAMLLLSLLGMIPATTGIARILINPLLILGGPLLLAVSALAVVRGSRYAVFYLVGWVPLLVVTVLGSLQMYDRLPDWTWSGDAAIAAGAFDALVLSLGLADRSLALRRDRDRARRLADIDPLTGLWNRRAWSERLQLMEESARRIRRPLSLLFMDLDHFKQLNDVHGHEAGDNALRLVADLMRRVLRNHEQIGRYGGEEFVVALPGADAAQALQIAERIRQQLQQMATSKAGSGQVVPTVSVGVATLRPGEDTRALIQRADAAMYAAKAAGRNRVVQAGEDDVAHAP